jgi:hypothetical protein
MIPLTTKQGLPPPDLKNIINNRLVYIWGSGSIGKRVLTSLKKSGVAPVGFIDGRASAVSATESSLPVANPSSIIDNPDTFIIIANLKVKDYAEQVCRDHGRMKMKDYITHYQIERPEAAVDIAGICNLTCPSCPRGNMESLIPDGLMTLETYKKVINKLSRDIPHLTNIELFTWGEPLLNPDIASIIETTEQTTPCTVSTNLMAIDYLDSVVQANPSQLTITINGFDAQYEQNMKGASWKRLLEHLQALSSLRKKQNPANVVTLHCFSYENNPNARTGMTDLAKRLGFSIAFGTHYVNPYENYLLISNKKDLSPAASTALINTAWDFDAMLKKAAQERDRPCLCQRIFPIINWNLSVSLCHVYYGPIIAENYLTIPWKDLLDKRHHTGQCISCQTAGLHRLDVDHLNRMKKP